jgi:transcription elongation factor Elf1
VVPRRGGGLLKQASTVLYPCPRCVAMLTSRCRLREHLLTTHCLICSTCGHMSGTVKEWLRHNLEVHKAPTAAAQVAQNKP